jgi:murein DD-endopeptidase MepM/ murein hydrolase activator NlpD
VNLLNKRRRMHPAVDLGDDDPIYTRSLANGPPDRRRISLRWLFGSVLTAIFSAGLVGGALQAAIGVDESFIVRPALARTPDGGAARVASKGDRFRAVAESEVTRRVIQIPTVVRAGDRDIVRVRPYAHIHTNLAAPVATEIAALVPSFNPLTIFAGDSEDIVDVAATSDSIYGAEVDGEVEIKTGPFPIGGALSTDDELALAEVEASVREAAPSLAEGVELASLPYVDPGRFEMSSGAANALSSLVVEIETENVTSLSKSDDLDDFAVEEELIPVETGASLREMLAEEGASDDDATAIVSALVANFSFTFRAGQMLRLDRERHGDGEERLVRVSLYERDMPIAAVALSDAGTYMRADPGALAADFPMAEEPPKAASAPANIYAGLWSAGLSLDMPEELIETIVHIFAYDVDYQGRLSPADSLEVVYSTDGDADSAEILYVAMTVGSTTHRFYRFRDPEDGTVDYYDESGKSAQKFLMRKPVGQGRFSSSFGMRKHPILRRYRMHSGIDWAAPTGTPIMAAGNGVVEKIGTRSGYGRSIVLSHANGYQTTYNHMSGYARGLEPGARVRQGQVIGYVGSTGLSTGPHLHFEVLVNGRFVDPMKIRLPRGRELQGRDLAAFELDRQRIDERLGRDDARFARAE